MSDLLRIACLTFLCVLLNVCRAYAYDTLCANGNSAFEADFRSGVHVNIGPPTSEGLATRVCRAVLSWDDQELVVAAGAAYIDLDLFGAELEPGKPVAAFQIKRSPADCCVSYQIYSLTKPPHLLRRLDGGGYFRAADTNLDGRIEIWTDDSAAVEGLEGLHTSDMEFPPTLVLRFEHDRLLDATSEFQTTFDDNIVTLRKQINKEDLHEFKDGRWVGGENTKLHTGEAKATQLRVLKTQVLEIVWAYLYSNREHQAWKSLREMWPSADVERIRSAIIAARARGLRRQLDGISNSLPSLQEESANIYSDTDEPVRPIMTRYYPPRSGEILRKNLKVELVVDCAGKVWSVKVAGHNKAVQEYVKRSTANWKFIPAFVNDQPVASRMRLTLSVRR